MRATDGDFKDWIVERLGAGVVTQHVEATDIEAPAPRAARVTDTPEASSLLARFAALALGSPLPPRWSTFSASAACSLPKTTIMWP